MQRRSIGCIRMGVWLTANDMRSQVFHVTTIIMRHAENGSSFAGSASGENTFTLIVL